eukprot:TRINITY_DN2487_c1_g1_i1.p1 TRINITY_DN2487_c1_g1~~TRINITY_DN2487_c1_g1_i1.p1  ORF type:complete len:338 (+),score=103.67 TRINITY_DN2487_c1_g1_i1:44-1057(+)
MAVFEAFERGQVKRQDLRALYPDAVCVCNPAFLPLSADGLRRAEEGELVPVILRATARFPDRVRIEQQKADSTMQQPPTAPAPLASVTQGIAATGTRHLSRHCHTAPLARRQMMAGLPGPAPHPRAPAPAGTGKKVIDFRKRSLGRAKEEYRALVRGAAGAAAEADAAAAPAAAASPPDEAAAAVAAPAELQSAGAVVAEGLLDVSASTVTVYDCIRVHGAEVGRAVGNDRVCLAAGFRPLSRAAMCAPDLQAVMFLHRNPVDGLQLPSQSHSGTSLLQLAKQLIHDAPFLRGRGGAGAGAGKGIRARRSDPADLQQAAPCDGTAPITVDSASLAAP